MSTTLLEPPSIMPVVTEMPCEERKQSAHDEPANWVSRMILKSYMSSFHLSLEGLGWVPKSILEVGSGDGTLLSYLAQNFMDARVIGVEFDADKIEHAKAKNCCRIEFEQLSDTETLPFDSNSFDLVISHGYLGASALPRHWVKEMARVSAEGLIISAPTPVGYKWLNKFPGADEARLIGNPVFKEGVTPISFSQLKTWVERSGAKIESVFNPLPYRMVLARKPQF